MRQLLQTLFFFLLVTQICFGQWYQQSSGTNKNLYSVQFTDANTGFAVGDSGTILKTTDGGGIWLTQNDGTIKHLYEVYFTTAETGWAVGDSGIILKTNNGGSNWLSQTSGTMLPLNGVCFVDASNGWAVGGEGNYGIGIILHTTNGGTDWVQQFEVMSVLRDICFIDASTGTAVGGWPALTNIGIILKTTDSGITWVEQLSGSFGCLYSITFTNSVTGFAVGVWEDQRGPLTRFFQTTDGGNTWLQNTTMIGNGYFNDVFFTDFNNGTIAGSTFFGGTILRTTDGGQNWILQISNTGELSGVSFTDANNGWAVGDNGTILHTTNGGVSFVEEEEINEIPSIYFLSNNFPNPFNPSTKINYSIPQSSNAEIKVFDILGNEIETLVNEVKPAGTYELTWYAGNLPSGVYFYQLKAGEFIETKKMLLLK